MKKYLFVVFAIVCTAFMGLHAQVTIKPAVGINLTDWSKDDASGNYTAKTGFQLGGTVSFGKKIYIEPGLFYVRKSTQYSKEGSSINDVKYDISGIRIPVTVGVNLLGNAKSAVGLRALGGVSAFLLTSTKDQDKEFFKSVAWGVHAGVGLDITIVFVEASYEWSLSNLQKDVSTIDVGKTRSLFVNAGVRIPI